jgi:hypothetical protein
MDKAVIFGGYEFLGFYLTTALLEKGNTVQCVHIHVNEDSNEESFLEEKRFTVGRNDNFSEIPLSKWANSSLVDGEKTVIMVSLYDLFLKNKSNEMISEIEGVFDKLLANEETEKATYILLLPMQFLVTGNPSFLHIRKNLERKKLTYKCIYIPTLFGPWQPMENIFQQAFLNEAREKEKIHLSKKEWVFDTIFVYDAACEILKVIENNAYDACILKSTVSDHWKKCAEFLSIQPSIYEAAFKQQKIVTDIPFTEVPETIEYKQALKHQKRHLLRILSGV